MNKLQILMFALFLCAPWAAGCSPTEGPSDSEDNGRDDGPSSSDDDDGDDDSDDDSPIDGDDDSDGSDDDSDDDDAPADDDSSSKPDASRSDAGGSSRSDGGKPPDRERDAGSMDEEELDGGGDDKRDADAKPERDAGDSTPDAAASDAGPQEPGKTCSLPTTYQWTSGPPITQPKNGWVSMKDFTHAFYNGVHVLYFTTFQTGWGAGMMTFKDWSEAASAPQQKVSFGVAPTLFYFRPKNVWVIAYQWGAHKFSYRTSSDPTKPNGWSAEKPLYRTALPPNGTGPIDQTVICDAAKCYLYYAGDNGHIYKSSMPIANFPGEFPAGKDSGIVGTVQNLFEGVQVYKVQGSDKYLMIVEAQGNGRYFRAFTATNLDGPWTLLTNEFAIKKNVSFTQDWTNDISHGDILRVNADETFTIDPCNLQMVFQGRDPKINTEYGRLPYRLGLITLKR